MTRGQDKVFLKLIPHAKEKVLCLIRFEKRVIHYFLPFQFNWNQYLEFITFNWSQYLQVVEGGGHFLQESHGEELADNILEFLKSQN